MRAEAELPIAVGGVELDFRSGIETTEHVPAGADARGKIATDRGQRRVGGEHRRARRLGPQVHGHAQAERAATQPVAGIIRPQPMILQLRTEEEFGLEATVSEQPSRSDVSLALEADHGRSPEVAGIVAIETTRGEELQQKSGLFETARAHDQPAMEEDPVAPEVSAGKNDDVFLPLVASRGRLRPSHHATTHRRRGEKARRASMPSGPHPRPSAPPQPLLTRGSRYN